jgi:hypothetical protein
MKGQGFFSRYLDSQDVNAGLIMIKVVDVFCEASDNVLVDVYC